MPPPGYTTPKSLPDFHLIFPNEEACIAYLFASHFPHGFICPTCGDTQELPLHGTAHYLSVPREPTPRSVVDGEHRHAPDKDPHLHLVLRSVSRHEPHARHECA